MKYLLPVLFILLLTNISAQYLDNPSFEGPVGIGITPPGWQSFDAFSTPDTEPLNCDNFNASHGETYITLIARGSDSSNPMSIENCQAQLLESLQPGECYSLSMDLASRDDLGHYVFGEGFHKYTASTQLKVYGSTNAEEKGDLLFESEPITNTQWETTSFSLKPNTEIAFILFEVALEQNSIENGNILLDHLVIESSKVSRVMLNDTLTISDLPYTLVASEANSYSWSENPGLSCYDCRSPKVTSTASATYTCTIISSTTGCPEDEVFKLTISDSPEPPSGAFKIPNVFTPNGDNFNDLFKITGLPPLSSLLVFDRSGLEVFRSEEYNNDWDGTDLQGNPLPEGTYWYVLITPGFSNKHKGNIYLKRE